MPMIRLVVLSILLFAAAAHAQSPRPAQTPPTIATSDADMLAYIARDSYRTAQSVEKLTAALAEFTKTFNSNQGLQLDDTQRWMLISLEVLNRLEASLANMQRLRLDLTERQSKIRLQLATVTDDLRSESIDRYVAYRGTTDAEGLREIRRGALTREQRELSTLLRQIEEELTQNTVELQRTQQQVRTIRQRVFGEVERQLGRF